MADVKLKVYWKYVIDACCGLIRVTKDVALWSYDEDVDPGWRRAAWLQENPSYQIGWFQSPADPACPEGEWVAADPSVAPVGLLYATGDRIVFNGGFLIVTDPGLHVHIDEWRLDPDRFSGLSGATRTAIENLPNVLGSIYWGENVRVVADFASNLGDCDAPLICLPQEGTTAVPGNLVIAERQDSIVADGRRCVFKIASLDLATEFVSNIFQLEGARVFHQLNVGQDRDIDVSDPRNRFEPLIGAIPLAWDIEDTMYEKYPFGLPPFDSFVFYVGFEPNEDTEEHMQFLGEIKRLVFDPNASCIECT